MTARHRLLGAIAVIALAGCSASGGSPTAVPTALVSATAAPAPPTPRPTPTPTPPSDVKTLVAATLSTSLSADAAYLRMRPDGQADLWVRFTNTTKSAFGFVDMNATLLSASAPVGTPVQAASVNTEGVTLAGAHDWLKATIPMSAADFAAINSVGLTELAGPPIPTTVGKASYTASNVTAVRQPDGSITVMGTLDGTLSGLQAFGGSGAFLLFVVLDPSGAPLGTVGAIVDPPVKGTTAFDHTPFSANSAAHDPSFPGPGPVMPPGDIGMVEIFTFG